MQRHLSDAVVLTSRFPATHTVLAAGEISRAHVQVIVEAGVAIEDDEARAAYEAAAVEIARRETPGRLRPAVRLLAARLHPVSLEERHAEAAKRRSVWVRDLDDGMAELIATLPAAIAHGIRDRLDRYARPVIDARRGGDGGEDTGGIGDTTLLDEPVQDTRRIDEVRADVFADLLLTGHATPEISTRRCPSRKRSSRACRSPSRS